MKRWYPHKKMDTGKDKATRFDRDPSGKTCGQCVHFKTCQDKYKLTEGHRACRNYVEQTP